jgi:hypothetical protein
MTFAKKRHNLLLAGCLLLAACERPSLKEAELSNGITVRQLNGFLLSPHPRGGFELVPEKQVDRIEKVSYTLFEKQELPLPLDSASGTAFGDTLHRVYGRTLKRNMGAFGAMMKSYLEYFDKFETLSLSTVERGRKKWMSLLKKHVEERHYWQSFYRVEGERVLFITLFFMLEEKESPMPEMELSKFIDAVQFNAENSSPQ